MVIEEKRVLYSIRFYFNESRPRVLACSKTFTRLTTQLNTTPIKTADRFDVGSVNVYKYCHCRFTAFQSRSIVVTTTQYYDSSSRAISLFFSSSRQSTAKRPRQTHAVTVLYVSSCRDGVAIRTTGVDDDDDDDDIRAYRVINLTAVGMERKKNAHSTGSLSVNIN